MKDRLGLVGKTLAEVATVLNDKGVYSYRVVRRDDVYYPCIRNYDVFRVNLVLMSGLVTEYDLG